MRKHRLALLTVTLMSCSPTLAQDWANWRGPSYNGSATGTNLPTIFSPKDSIKWSADMPGPSAGTPIVYGDCVFVSSTDPKSDQLCAICLDRKTGAVRWKHQVSSGYQAGGAGTKLQLDANSNYASPSPVTDGKRVIFFYGNGDLMSFNLDGVLQWKRNIQKDFGDFAFQWTFSSNPQLWNGKLYLQILQRNQPAAGGRGKDGAESFLLAMDPETGKDLWKSVRPTNARMESREAYSTPIPFIHNGRKELLIAGGDMLSGHDPDSGKELWRWGTYNPDHREIWWRLVPSPVAGGGVVLACAPKTAPVYAAKLGATGDVSATGLAWKSEDRSPITSDVPTPLFYQGKFFVASDVRKAISCVEPATGKALWTTELPRTSMCWGSPTGADGKIYLINLKGDVFVIDAATGAIISTNPMAQDENDIRSSIAVAYNQLFIRTNSKLYCIGK